MKDYKRLIDMFRDIQQQIINTHDNNHIDSEVEDLFDYIISKLDEAINQVVLLHYLEDGENLNDKRKWISN